MTIEEAIEYCEKIKIFFDWDMFDHEKITQSLDTALASLRAQQEVKDLRRERDAAIADINLMGGCPICKHNVGRSDRTGLPICEKKHDYPSNDCFEWRGFQEQEAEK